MGGLGLTRRNFATKKVRKLLSKKSGSSDQESARDSLKISCDNYCDEVNEVVAKRMKENEAVARPRLCRMKPEVWWDCAATACPANLQGVNRQSTGKRASRIYLD